MFFSKMRKAPDGLQHYCKKCQREIDHLRPARNRGYQWSLNLKRYGVTIDQYEELFESQSGLCAICKRPETATRNGKLRRLCVDHCHDSQTIRGLLCSDCNRAIGLFKNDLDILANASVYLLLPAP